MRSLLVVAVCALGAAQSGGSAALWIDVTKDAIGVTAEWTNKVEIADINGDGRPDLLFANGGNYSEPGTPEMNRAFINKGGLAFEDRSEQVFGTTPDLARVIKARDLDGDGNIDILVGTTYQTQSRLYLGAGGGAFREVTTTHLPRGPVSAGDLEFGDVDADGDLDVVLADWGPGNNMTNDGGRTRLWLNDGRARFTDATAVRMPATQIRFSWDLELVDVDNDYDLDVLVSCKRCGNSTLFRNNGAGGFTEDLRALPQYTNNYEFEPMDLDGDGFLDLVTINDGDIVDGNGFNRREHVFRNDGGGRFRDLTDAWWRDEDNIGEDDNLVAFLDLDSDGDADFVIGSLSGPDRVLLNDGRGHLTLRAGEAFQGEPTPGTLGLALADLDADGRIDAVQGQGENPKATDERVFAGRGLAPDTAAPTVTLVTVTEGTPRIVRARVHDRKSPSLPFEWKSVVLQMSIGGGVREVPMQWYGEYLWRAMWPSDVPAGGKWTVCATDAAGNGVCGLPQGGAASAAPAPTQ
jgi:hypothetical protein